MKSCATLDGQDQITTIIGSKNEVLLPFVVYAALDFSEKVVIVDSSDKKYKQFYQRVFDEYGYPTKKLKLIDKKETQPTTRLERSKNIAESRNIALTHAATSLVLRLDGDEIPYISSFKRLIEKMKDLDDRFKYKIYLPYILVKGNKLDQNNIRRARHLELRMFHNNPNIKSVISKRPPMRHYQEVFQVPKYYRKLVINDIFALHLINFKGSRKHLITMNNILSLGAIVQIPEVIYRYPELLKECYKIL